MPIRRTSLLPSNHAYYGDRTRSVTTLSNQEQKVFWDIVVTHKGKYNFTLEGILDGDIALEAGLWIPNQANKLINQKGRVNTLPIKLSKVKTNRNYFLGAIYNLDPGTYHFYIKNISEITGGQITIQNLKVMGYHKVTSVFHEDILSLRAARHASAAYSKTYFKVPKDEGKYFYRELCLHQLRPLTYHTFAFSGGYIGLSTTNRYFDANRKYPGREHERTQFVFSIWDYNDREAVMHQPNENLIYRDFGHEGSGVHSHYITNLHQGYKYGILLKMEHVEGDEELTDYSAYVINRGPLEPKYRDDAIIDPEKELPMDKWTFLATIRRPGHHYVGSHRTDSICGGFSENIGKSNGHIYHRRFLSGNDWASRDGKDWIPAYRMMFLNKDPENSNCIPRPDLRMLDIGIGGNIPVSEDVQNGYMMMLPKDPAPVTPDNLVNFLEMTKKID